MAYQLSSNFRGQALLSAFNFFDGSDPSHGYVSYQNQHNAQAMGLYSVDEATNSVRLGVDSRNVYPLSHGRPSLRLESKQAFDHGLFIADFGHMPPSTCGLWPAFWAFGDPWPNHGEIDIIEGVNTNTQNIISAHTLDGCSISPSLANGLTGSLRTLSCGVGSDNVGCGVDPPSGDASSYGDGFNAAGGGVYAMKWESDFISVWHFARDDIPDDIDRKKPNPGKWGLPQAIFGGPGCNVDSFFNNMNLVININFCGDYGGSVWGKSDSCDALAPTCNEYVANNPHAFADAYWDVNYIDIYQVGAKTVEDPWPFDSSTWSPFQSTSWPFAGRASTSDAGSSTTSVVPSQVELSSPVTASVRIPSTSVAPSVSVATSALLAASTTHLPPSSPPVRASSTASVVSHPTSSLSRLTAVVNASSSSSVVTGSSSSRTSLDSRTSAAPLSTTLPVKVPELTRSMLNVSQVTGTKIMPANIATSSALKASSSSLSSISSSAMSSAVSTMSSKPTSAKVALPTNLDAAIPTTVSASSHAAPPSTAERIPEQSAESKVITAEHLMQWNSTTFATATVTQSKAFTTTHVFVIIPLASTHSFESAAHTVSSIMTVVEHQVETDSVTVTETRTRTQSLDETWTWKLDAATTPAAPSTVSQAAAASSPQFPVDAVAEPAETPVLVDAARPIRPVAAPSPLDQPTPSLAAPAADLAMPAAAPTRFHHYSGNRNISNAAFMNATGVPSRPKTALIPVPAPPLPPLPVANAPLAKIPMDSVPQPSQLFMGSAAPSDLARTSKSAVFAGLIALVVMMVANA